MSANGSVTTPIRGRPAITGEIIAYRWRITEPLLRSRSGALIAVLALPTVATGLLQICLPLELRQLHASPSVTGLTLSMFGFGMFAFEWLWGIAADRFGYRAPLIVAQLLYAGAIVFLSQVQSVPLIALGYFVSAGMMVAVGPIARSYVGTTVHVPVRATGQALLAAQWAIASAVGAGVGGPLIDRFPIGTILLLAASLPAVAAVLVAIVFRGYRRTDLEHGQAVPAKGVNGTSDLIRVFVVVAALTLLIQIGLGGEIALLPRLVTDRLQLSAGAAGSAMLAVVLISGALLIPGGSASDRWGRRPTMVAGGLICACGYVIYALAGSLPVVIAGAAVRAIGASLIWPAATAWVAESMPRARHAFYMGLFGEFENVGFTVGPIVGGLVWAAAGIQSAFYVYALTTVAAAGLAALMVARAGRENTLVKRWS